MLPWLHTVYNRDKPKCSHFSAHSPANQTIVESWLLPSFKETRSTKIFIEYRVVLYVHTSSIKWGKQDEIKPLNCIITYYLLIIYCYLLLILWNATIFCQGDGSLYQVIFSRVPQETKGFLPNSSIDNQQNYNVLLGSMVNLNSTL